MITLQALARRLRLPGLLGAIRAAGDPEQGSIGGGSTPRLTSLEAVLGYRFQDRDVLDLALLHRSAAAEAGSADSYERLEFLGDAVLQLAVTHYLYDSHPDLDEGKMAKVRAAVVDAKTLASLAREFGVGEAIALGHGEEATGGREKDSILADVVEALLGAVYLDGGYPAARDVILAHWQKLVDARAAAPGMRDYKTRLQEMLAAGGNRPSYRVEETGPDHAKQFAAEVWVEERKIGAGEGTSKKRAEQDAARDAVARLDSGDA